MPYDPLVRLMLSLGNKFMLPNEDFGRPNKHLRLHFRSTFKRFVAQIMYSHPLKVLRKCSLKGLFILPKSSFGMDKVVTKDHNIPEKPAHRMLLLSFESSCKLVTNDHGIPEKTNTSNHMRCYYLLYHLANLLQMIIAYQKNQHITHTHVATIFVNHLANSMLPKRRFWKAEQTYQSAFSKHLSTFRSPNTVLTPLKKASKTHSEMLPRPSKIFVWDG